MRVRFGSSLQGLTSQTTMEWQIPCHQSCGILANLMSWKVFVPSMCCCLGNFEPFPIPWQIWPTSLAYKVFQMCENLGCLCSWRYCRNWPEVSLRTGIAKLWRNLARYLRWAAWGGVMALAMFAVCERVRLAMGAV